MADLWWLPLSIKDAIDIFILALFLRYAYNLLKGSGSKALFMGFIAFFVLWAIVSQILEMRLMGALLDKFVNIGLLILVIIFQEEIKKILISIGSASNWQRFTGVLRDRNGQDKKIDNIAPIILACKNMAKKKVGALIVIQQNLDLSPWMHAGERFTCDINSRIIENIFFKNSPLHDGAMVIVGDKIKAAGVILPVANNADLNKDLGLRHRAALGLALKTDGIVIIISEERGHISVAHQGEIQMNISIDQLQSVLERSSL